jgi:hypothetical protein
MFRQMGVTFVLAGSVILLAGCGRRNDAAKNIPTDNQQATSLAAAQRVTLHVKDMIGRQGIT